jgi:t-SNARE complex subunit (syntaxin)
MNINFRKYNDSKYHINALCGLEEDIITLKNIFNDMDDIITCHTDEFELIENNIQHTSDKIKFAEKELVLSCKYNSRNNKIFFALSVISGTIVGIPMGLLIGIKVGIGAGIGTFLTTTFLNNNII